MTLYQLKIFEAVARHLNITQAALELHASQPAVSQQLKLLEENYEARFLVRHSHGVKLTDKGEAFLKAITPVLAQLEDIEHRFKGNENAKSPQCLAVGGSHNVSVRVLTKLLRTFKDSHPATQFMLAANESSVIEKQLLNSELDIGVITNPSYVAQFIYEPYNQMGVVACCVPTNAVAGKMLSLRELAEYPLIVKTGGMIESVLTSQGYRMNFTLRCEVSEAVKAAVRMGMGIGVVYQNAIARNIARGDLKLINVPELKEIGIQSFIVYDGRKPLSSIAQDFLALLRKRKQPVHKLDERMTALITGLNGRGSKPEKPQRSLTKGSRRNPLLRPPSVA